MDIRDRAWSTLELKSFDERTRTFEGIASTPSTDNGGDVVDPLGATFSLPMPLLWQHAKEHIKDPVGQITHATATRDGIRIRGHFAKFDEPPSLKDDCDRAWQLARSGYVRGLSIGFRLKEYKPNKAGGYDIAKWAWHELSAVRVAMNQDASITSIKSIDRAARASSGIPAPQSTVSPGASGNSPRGVGTMKPFHEQIAELGEERQQKQTEIKELLATVGDDSDKLTGDDLAKFDDLGAELKSIDERIRRKEIQSAAAGTARPVATYAEPAQAWRPRAGDFVEKSNLPPGTRFARAVHAKVAARIKGVTMTEVADWARREWPDTPEVAAYLKADPGTGLSGNWAEVLNPVNTIENEFLAELRPATIVGQLGLRPAPFNRKMIVQGPASSSANWVGNNAAKPVGQGVYDEVQIGQHKIAEIIVLTEDQILSSAIDSVEATRQDLIERIAQFADEQFTDPTVAAGANNPASVLNGVTAISSNGATAEDLRADLDALLSRFIAHNIPLSNVTLIMSSYVALGISGLRSALSTKEFPDMTVNGGNIDGIRVIVSNNVGGTSTGSNLIAVVPRYILLAQAGGIRVDMSREATIDMAGGTSPTYSLYQRNAVGLRCEWFVSWIKAHSAAAQYVSGAAYSPQPAA